MHIAQIDEIRKEDGKSNKWDLATQNQQKIQNCRIKSAIFNVENSFALNFNWFNLSKASKQWLLVSDLKIQINERRFSFAWALQSVEFRVPLSQQRQTEFVARRCACYCLYTGLNFFLRKSWRPSRNWFKRILGDCDSFAHLFNHAIPCSLNNAENGDFVFV